MVSNNLEVIKIEKKNPFKNTKQQDAQENTKLVGAYLPVSLVEHLRLLALYCEDSLQGLVQKVLSEWLENVNMPEKKIISELVERAYSEWGRRLETENKHTVAGVRLQKKYLEEIEDRLRRRKVSEDHINRILRELENKMVQKVGSC